jgi:hypothetical protein
MIRPRKKPRPGRLKGNNLIGLRIACYNRDKGRCRKCGAWTCMGLPHEHPLSFHMAHIRNKRMHGDHIDQVQTECGDCHRTYHNYGPSMLKPCPAKERPQA